MGEDQEQLSALSGARVVDPDGNEVGKVREIYLDDTTGEPAWVAVTTAESGPAQKVVPLLGARAEDGEVLVPYPAELVERAPSTVPDAQLDEAALERWYEHYGLVGMVGADPSMGGDSAETDEDFPADLSGYSPDRPAAHAAAYEGGDNPSARLRLRRHEGSDHTQA